jgi:hypothetical protein
MKQKTTVVIPAEHQARIRALIDKVGASQASDFLMISLQTMKFACVGIPVHRGTSAWIEKQILQRDKDGKAP